MNNSNILQFYPTNYGHTRFVAFKILQKFFDVNNSQAILTIFNLIIEEESQKNSLSNEDYLQQIDNDLMHQILVGVIDNQEDIRNIINKNSSKNYDMNFMIILMLLIFELKFLSENSSQNIFDEYQKICQENDIKFDKELVFKLIKIFREFEFL